MPGRPALVVMVRTATPGRVKTRLAGPLGDHAAATVYRALRDDTLVRAGLLGAAARAAAARPAAGIEAADASRPQADPPHAAPNGRPVALFLAVEPGGDELSVADENPAGASWERLEQRGADLGSRLAGVFADLFEAGHDPVVIIGSDSPALPPAFLERAMDALTGEVGGPTAPAADGGGGTEADTRNASSDARRRADIALGPAFDGGYYLIGVARAAWEEESAAIGSLLRDSPMGTPRVAEYTRTGAERLGLRVAELPLWTDVDEVRDLAQATGLLPGLSVGAAVAGTRGTTDRQPRAGASGRLRELYLHVTHRCGTGCPQCYLRDARDPDHDRSRELTTAEWRGIVDQAAALGATGFVIIGGDPFLRPDLLAIIDYITGGRGGKARLFFNRPVSLEAAGELAAVGRGRLTPLLSIDGTEAANDALRGPGNFADAVSSLRSLLGAGLSPVVNTVLLRPVLPALPELAARLAREGVATMHLILPHQRGGLSDRADMVPSADELLAAVTRLVETADGLGLAIDNIAAWKGRLRAPRDLCGAGCDLLAVDPEGLVHACPITCGDGGFVAGDLRVERLEAIWRRSPSLELLRATHARDREECRDCPVVDACGGECWVQAHYAARARGERAGYLAPFPYCGLVRPVLEGLGAGKAGGPEDVDGGGDGDARRPGSEGPGVGGATADLTPFDCI